MKRELTDASFLPFAHAVFSLLALVSIGLIVEAVAPPGCRTSPVPTFDGVGVGPVASHRIVVRPASRSQVARRRRVRVGQDVSAPRLAEHRALHDFQGGTFRGLVIDADVSRFSSACCHSDWRGATRGGGGGSPRGSSASRSGGESWQSSCGHCSLAIARRITLASALARWLGSSSRSVPR